MHGLKPEISFFVIESTRETIDKTLEFYKSLGFEFEKEDHKPCGEHYSSDSGGVTLEIYIAQFVLKKKPPIGIKYENLNEVVHNVDERYHGRCQLVNGRRVVKLLDPDGRLVVLEDKK